MNVLAPGVRYIDLQFRGTPHVIATAVLEGRGRVALVDPGPDQLAAGAACGARARRALARRRRHDPADAHPSRSRRCGRDDRRRASARSRLRARARRAASGRSDEAAEQRDAALRRSDGRVLGRSFSPSRHRRSRRSPAARRSTPAGARWTWPTRRVTRSHHLACFDRDSGIAFVGDVAGAARARQPLRAAADAAAGHRSRRLGGQHRSRAAWHPNGLFLTHFGLVSTPAPHLQELLSGSAATPNSPASASRAATTRTCNATTSSPRCSANCEARWARRCRRATSSPRRPTSAGRDWRDTGRRRKG